MNAANAMTALDQKQQTWQQELHHQDTWVNKQLDSQLGTQNVLHSRNHSSNQKSKISATSC